MNKTQIGKPTSEPYCFLITGAARRVGAAIARQLHLAGGNIIIHYRHSAGEAAALMNELNQQRPGSAAIVHADLLDYDSLPVLVANAISCFGRLDALINNASLFYPTPLGHIDSSHWHELIGSNLQAPLFLSQAASDALRKTQGAIVNITDIHAERPLRTYPLYCISKAGLLGMTRALALELAPDVRVNAVAPGAILWPEDGQFSLKEQRTIIDNTLLHRAGAPEDIARTVRFLLYDARYITGQVIPVDGGRSIYLR